MQQSHSSNQHHLRMVQIGILRSQYIENNGSLASHHPFTCFWLTVPRATHVKERPGSQHELAATHAQSVLDRLLRDRDWSIRHTSSMLLRPLECQELMQEIDDVLNESVRKASDQRRKAFLLKFSNNPFKEVWFPLTCCSQSPH